MRLRRTVEDDDFVRCVDIQDVVEWPSAIVGVQGRVGARVVGLDRRVGESRNKLLDVTHALYTGDRRAEGGVVPEN